MKFFIFSLTLLLAGVMSAQTGAGVGLYATGSETGIGFRSGKETRWVIDARIAKANIYSEKNKASSFSTELSGVCRIVKLEKVRFHLGLGYKAEWNIHAENRHGLVVPVGVEAFPFPFQNAGLFFEAAAFCMSDPQQNYYSGIRTSAGFVFYFIRKPKLSNTTAP
ncbi:hypothetical protein CNR22_17305 [Sphingobacteriaceae bacterium]|nr:hypothetical protein CNR22_17305 [Sphingobacteriaceae bacterium]